MNIQWYPGHMAKAKRLLIEQLKKADFIIELADARIPLSSRNPDLLRIVENKKRVLVLAKADLAEAAATQRWLATLRGRGESVTSFDANPKSRNRLLQFIDTASAEFIARAENRGIKKIIRAMVIGVPNVGKSTFINRMCGAAITSVANKPGHTRSNRWVKAGPYLELMDSPGMLWPRLDSAISAQRLAYIGTIKDAVYNTEELSMELLWELFHRIPQETAARFKLKESSYKSKLSLLDALCQGRGFLMKGGSYDYERACAVLLEEFRSGKVGRVSFEVPEETWD